jgi:hypothetical protein
MTDLTANKPQTDDDVNMDQSYEYSVINATFEPNSDYYPKQEEANKPVETLGIINNAFNNDYIQVNIKKEEGLFKETDTEKPNLSPVKPVVKILSPVVKIISPVKQPTVTKFIAGTDNLNNHASNPIKTDLDKLPPQIEISMYGSETLPEFGEFTEKTPLTTLECKGRQRSKLKTR